MAQTYVVGFQHPVAWCGVGVLLGAVAGEVVYQTLEIERFAILYQVDFQSGEGDVFQVHGVADQLQQAGFDVKGVETGEYVGAVILVQAQAVHRHVACVYIQFQTFHVHLAAHQLLAMAVDVALGYRSGNEGGYDDDSQQYPYYPERYFQSPFHIIVSLFI